MIHPVKVSLLLSSLLFSVFLTTAANAEVSVALRLDRHEATTADSIRMVVSISGTRSSDLEPRVAGIEAFSLSSGGTSSRIQIINGKVDAGVDYTYFIRPKRTGSFQIGPASVRVDRKTYSSNTVFLKIAEQAQATGIDRGPLFLTARVSSTEIYVEQQVIYTLKFYRQVKVSDLSLSLSDMEHLIFKQLGKPLEYESVYNGKRYQVVEVSHAAIASKGGDYTIGPARMTMTVYEPSRRSRRSSFDDPFFSSFSSSRPVTLAGETLQLHVMPLPEEGRPTDFSGLVGGFKISSGLSPSQIKEGESATLTVVVSGRGNVKRIPDLTIPEIRRIKIYADQPELEVDTDRKGLMGSKTMKWAFVPESIGDYKIPPLSVSFFDTASSQYEVLKTLPLSLSVLPGEKDRQIASIDITKGETVQKSAKERIKEIGHDILPVHTSIKLLNVGLQPRSIRLILFAALIAPFLVYVMAFCLMRLKKRSKKAFALTKARKAAKTFMRKCGRGKLVPADFHEAIRSYLNDRFGLLLGSVTPQEAVEILVSRGVNPDTAQKMKSVLHGLEDAIYTGSRANEMYETHGDISNLVRRIEKEIKD